MSTTSRRLATTVIIVLATALFATGCIGYDPKQAPVAGGTTSLVFHPKFANTTLSLDGGLANNPGAAYKRNTDKGRLDYVIVSFDFLRRATREAPDSRGVQIGLVSHAGALSRFGTKIPSRILTAPNGSFTVPYHWPDEMCAGSTIKVMARWSNLGGWTTERLEIPVTSGRPCPAKAPNWDSNTWVAMERNIKNPEYFPR